MLNPPPLRLEPDSASIREFHKLARMLCEQHGHELAAKAYGGQPSIRMQAGLMTIRIQKPGGLNVSAVMSGYGPISALSVIDSEVVQYNSDAIREFLPELKRLTVLDRIADV